MPVPHPNQPLPFKAYVSEPITRCPPREKGRIQTLVRRLTRALAEPPYLTRLYVPSLVTSPEVRDEMKPEHVYLLDRVRVAEADYMLVIADHTSFGIGGEVEMATSLGKPVIIFSRDQTLSRFLVGTPANVISARQPGRYFLAYRDWRDLREPLLELIERVLVDLKEEKRHELSFWDLGRELRALRLRRGLSIEELARRSGLRPAQLRILETSIDEIRKQMAEYRDQAGLDLGSISLGPRQLEQLANIGLPALRRLAVALDVSLQTLAGGNDEPKKGKGPSREAETMWEKAARIRAESLKPRAAQYDITYREYESLHELLVTRYLERTPAARTRASRHSHLISEDEFLQALGELRA